MWNLVQNLWIRNKKINHFIFGLAVWIIVEFLVNLSLLQPESLDGKKCFSRNSYIPLRCLKSHSECPLFSFDISIKYWYCNAVTHALIVTINTRLRASLSQAYYHKAPATCIFLFDSLIMFCFYFFLLSLGIDNWIIKRSLCKAAAFMKTKEKSLSEPISVSICIAVVLHWSIVKCCLYGLRDVE